MPAVPHVRHAIRGGPQVPQVQEPRPSRLPRQEEREELNIYLVTFTIGRADVLNLVPIQLANLIKLNVSGLLIKETSSASITS